MTRHEKQIVGIAKLLADIDCGALHRGNWRLPCPTCVQKERELTELLISTIRDGGVERHVRLGHDERDGNKPKRLYST
jgi:hypothetical protein